MKKMVYRYIHGMTQSNDVSTMFVRDNGTIEVLIIIKLKIKILFPKLVTH